ncbi:glycosyltransferase [Frigoribacterium sp. CFBP 13712]|uniref:glycosyltransferase n=1 Tax=Frigoribacterium sp. CFBP 13712 TaxID=2775309 RepID=UPI00352BD23A
MTRPVVGWYLHHHGGGHVARFRAVRPQVDADVVVFSSRPAPDDLPADTRWTTLPPDAGVEIDDAGRELDPAGADPTADGVLHWAPLGHRGHRDRLAAIAETVARERIDAMVVDVSVEVGLLARLLGVPVVLFTQPGDRDDEPHALIERLAAAIVAPWPRELMEPAHLAAHRDLVACTGGISRHDGRAAPREPAAEPDGTRVLVLAGGGGHDVTADDIEEARAATPGTHWTVLGVDGVDGQPSVVVDDPWPALNRADVVVTWAGQNAVADIAAAGARAIVVPQTRPFGEQIATATALDRAGLAVVEPVWPTAERWPEVIARALELEPDWARWGTAGAARRAADVIERVAGSEQQPGRHVAVVTLCSVARLDHLRHQLAAVVRDAASPEPGPEPGPDASAPSRSTTPRVSTVVVWLDDEPAPSDLGVDLVVHMPPAAEGFRLAAARNAGADAAVGLGADLVVFLDADCVPSPSLVSRYVDAARAEPDAVLCGPVTYLAPGVDVDDPAVLAELTAPHAARPAPPAGLLTRAGDGEYALFWSLSFALTARAWRSGPRFDERYVGYGGEDTDFAFAFRRAGRPLVWVGGADAYHQHHPTSSPPWQHLDDVLRNGRLFAEQWGEWPMTGWLEAFARGGAVRRVADGWERVPEWDGSPRPGA